METLDYYCARPLLCLASQSLRLDFSCLPSVTSLGDCCCLLVCVSVPRLPTGTAIPWRSPTLVLGLPALTLQRPTTRLVLQSSTVAPFLGHSDLRLLQSSAAPVLDHTAALAPGCPALGVVATTLDTRSVPTLDHSGSTATVRRSASLVLGRSCLFWLSPTDDHRRLSTPPVLRRRSSRARATQTLHPSSALSLGGGLFLRSAPPELSATFDGFC